MWPALWSLLVALFRPWLIRLGVIIGSVAALNSEKTTEWLSEHGFKWLANAIHKITAWALDGILVILKGVFYLVIDGVLLAIKTFVDGLDFSSVVFQWAAGKAAIPSQATYFMVQIGFPEFVTIISSAYALRLLINLIPAAVTRA